MQNKKVTINYEKSPHYKIHNCDGLWGGVSSHGKIFVDVYTEHPPIPTKETLEITDGVNTNKKTDLVDGHILRTFVCGLVMDISTASSIGNWLLTKVQEAQNISEVQNNDE